MDLKKISLIKYLVRTAILAIPGGVIIGYVIMAYTSNMIEAVMFSGFMAGLLGVAISSKNFRQLIAPIKTIIDDLEVLISKSNVKVTDDINTINGIKHGFTLILNDLTGNLKKMTCEIEEYSSKLVDYSQQTVDGAMNTASSIAQVAASVQQVSTSSQHIAETSDETTGYAKVGSDGIERIATQMGVIQQTAARSGDVIQGLNESAQKISQIIVMITQIAEKTNLLALNAAIEAARAGDYGKGFAVVADEVRNLAEQSAGAAKKIQELIMMTQNEMAEAVGSTSDGMMQVENGLQVVRDVSGTFKVIISSVQNLAENIQMVTASTEEIASAIHGVTDTAEKQTFVMEKVAVAAQNLNRLALELKNLSIRFDVSTRDN